MELGHEVVVVDDLSTNEGRSANPEATLVEGSVTDLELLKSATEGARTAYSTRRPGRECRGRSTILSGLMRSTSTAL